MRVSALVLAAYGGLILLTGVQFWRAPGGFIPAQDQGYFITVVQLPPGSSLARTDAVVQRAIADLLGHSWRRAHRELQRLRRRHVHERQ